MVLSIFGGAAVLEERFLKKDFVNPSSMGFTNTVAVTAGGVKTIYVSGQVGYGPEGTPDSVEGQADLAFSNVVQQLTDAGAGVEDVVKISVYIKDMDRPKMQAVGAAKARCFTMENQPASTWVGVTSLVFPALEVEVEVIAMIEVS